MGDVRRQWHVLLLVLVGSLPLGYAVDPLAFAWGFPCYVVAGVAHEAARYVTYLATGVPGARIDLARLAPVSEGKLTPRQAALGDAVPACVSIVLGAAGFAVAPLPYAAAFAYGNAAYAFLLSGVWRCIWHESVLDELRAYRESRRASGVLDAVAAIPEGPGKYDAAVDRLTAALARDPANLVLSQHLVVRLVAALRPEEAASELGRVAVLRAAGDRGRRRAACGWADLVLTYPDVLSTRVPTAMRLLHDVDLGCGFMAHYLRALSALRSNDHAVALAQVDEAVRRWEGGQPVSGHALGCAFGIRASALLALGRREEAAAAIDAGLRYDPGCAIPDVLDEAKAALAA